MFVFYYTPPKINIEPRWFSSTRGVLSGSMLIFQGVHVYTIRHLIQRWFLQVVLRMFLGTGKKEEGVCLDKTDLERFVTPKD